MPWEHFTLTVNSSFAFARHKMTMDFVVAFALQKKVPELKDDKRQVACLKWMGCREDQQVNDLGCYF